MIMIVEKLYALLLVDTRIIIDAGEHVSRYPVPIPPHVLAVVGLEQFTLNMLTLGMDSLLFTFDLPLLLRILAWMDLVHQVDELDPRRLMEVFRPFREHQVICSPKRLRISPGGWSLTPTMMPELSSRPLPKG